MKTYPANKNVKKILVTMELYDLDKDKPFRIPNRVKKQQKYGKKNPSPYQEEENCQWENECPK